ncbi:MAG: argininosuccinate lyase [Thermomicrobiales bacterium]|nr:argininosuccinate lyase [Thermomicrobiales bacterium]
MADTIGSRKAWGGRFSENPDTRLEAFNASVGFDIRMVREDIRASIAHARMLGTQQIIDTADAETIIDALWSILGEVEAGTFMLTIADEDVHTGVERRLRELIGATAGRLHTGRSRNDQVANDFRFWTKRQLIEVASGLIDLINGLLEISGKYADVVMPGYTHVQRAQPVLFSHHMHAYCEMFLRDLERVRQAYDRTDVLALGSAALAGATYPLDREMVAAELHFARISRNSMDAVGDRDFVLDALYACSVIAMHISRLSEELVYWSSGEFGYITIADRFSTGSSIMPQKKNADIAELGRGKSGRVFGNLIGMLVTMKGQPMTYNKDSQEDKEGLIDSIDTILAVLDVFPPMISSITVHGDRTAAASVKDFTLATDAADVLAKAGIPFREAHEIVGTLVGDCIRAGKTFADLTDDEWAAVHPVFAEQRPPLDGLGSTRLRDLPGGTAPNRVNAARDEMRALLSDENAWVTSRRAEQDDIFTRG